MRNICVVCGGWMDHDDEQDPDYPVCPACQQTSNNYIGEMKKMSEWLVSPVGEIKFMAVKQKYNNKMKGTQEFSISIVLDEKDAGVKDFVAALKKVNPNLGSTNGMEAGKVKVTASSQYQPKVEDPSGQQIEGDNIPFFPQGSTGKAEVVVKTFTSSKGGGINLVAVGLKELNLGEVKEYKPKSIADIKNSLGL